MLTTKGRDMLKVIISLALVVGTVFPAQLYAQSAEQELLRDASGAGMLPFAQLRDQIARQIPGRMVGAELDEARARRGDYIYRMTFLQSGGNTVNVFVDARTGSIVGTEGQ
jgi:uncharacterized membrane protein YkoI